MSQGDPAEQSEGAGAISSATSAGMGTEDPTLPKALWGFGDCPIRPADRVAPQGTTIRTEEENA